LTAKLDFEKEIAVKAERQKMEEEKIREIEMIKQSNILEHETTLQYLKDEIDLLKQQVRHFFFTVDRQAEIAEQKEGNERQ
jgi:hypothetical protein